MYKVGDRVSFRSCEPGMPPCFKCAGCTFSREPGFNGIAIGTIVELGARIVIAMSSHRYFVLPEMIEDSWFNQHREKMCSK